MPPHYAPELCIEKGCESGAERRERQSLPYNGTYGKSVSSTLAWVSRPSLWRASSASSRLWRGNSTPRRGRRGGGRTTQRVIEESAHPCRGVLRGGRVVYHKMSQIVPRRTRRQKRVRRTWVYNQTHWRTPAVPLLHHLLAKRRRCPVIVVDRTAQSCCARHRRGRPPRPLNNQQRRCGSGR